MVFSFELVILFGCGAVLALFGVGSLAGCGLFKKFFLRLFKGV